jgi:hypothetical protein
MIAAVDESIGRVTAALHAKVGRGRIVALYDHLST